MEERQKIAAAQGDDTDIFGYYAEPPLVAVNLFHLRGGHIVDRREFFWEDSGRFRAARICAFAAEAALSRGGIPAEDDSRAGGF